MSVAADLRKLQRDLDCLSTGMVAWSRALQALTSSDESIQLTSQGFHWASDRSSLLLFRNCRKEWQATMETFSGWWLSKSDPTLKSLQDFVSAAVQQSIDILGKLKGLNPDNLRRSVEFFYTAPSQEALTGVHPRGFHVD